MYMPITIINVCFCLFANVCHFLSADVSMCAIFLLYSTCEFTMAEHSSKLLFIFVSLSDPKKNCYLYYCLTSVITVICELY
jgi:hypothetical protein